MGSRRSDRCLRLVVVDLACWHVVCYLARLAPAFFAGDLRCRASASNDAEVQSFRHSHS